VLSEVGRKGTKHGDPDARSALRSHANQLSRRLSSGSIRHLMELLLSLNPFIATIH
jgi:hypothetical protein